MVKGWGAVLRQKLAAVAALSTKAIGDSAEDRALDYLQQQGLRLVCRNYRLAGGPRRRGAEIDLILQDGDGTLVFTEVRARRSVRQGGAAASVLPAKQRRIVRAAQQPDGPGGATALPFRCRGHRRRGLAVAAGRV